MPEVIASELSLEDQQLIETHQLGAPLAVYRLKPGSIRSSRWTGIMILSMGIISLLLIVGIVYLERLSGNSELLFLILALFTGIGNVVRGLQYLYRLAPGEQRTHLILCENGLVYVSPPRVQAVRWEDIRLVSRFLIGDTYNILLHEGKEMVIGSRYQQFDEMIAFLEQYCEVVS